MGRSREEKLFRYVKDGRIKRVRSFLRKYNLNLNVKNGKERTVLHVACLLGEDAIVNVLLRHGASREAKDKDGNTPLHLALKYALQVLEKGVYNDLISPLLNQNQDIQDVANDNGESPRQLLKELKKELKRKKEERQIFEEQEEHKREEARQRKEWNEKLFFEVGNEDEDFTSFTGIENGFPYETYDEWADRIRQERYLKQRVSLSNRQKKRKSEKETRDQRKKEEGTRALEQEYQAYVKDVSQRKQPSLLELKSDYDSRCNTVFSASMTTNLSFVDVPWPCKGTVEEMIKMISKWSCTKDKKKYLKEQQIRWHPDKFLQKCGERLIEKDKEKILDYVNQLSQEINRLIED